MATRKFLGEMLLEAGLISPEQLEEAISCQKQSEGQKLGPILVERGWVTQQQIEEVIVRQGGVRFIDLAAVVISKSMIELVPQSMARRNHLVPVRVEAGKLWVAMEDPLDMAAIQDVGMSSQMEVEPLASNRQMIDHAIDDLYGNVAAERAIEEFQRESDVEQAAQLSEGRDEVGNALIVRLIDSLLERAVRAGASDIHIEPQEDEVRVRMRLDGSLVQVLTTPRNAHSAMLTRIKIMSNLNIAEKRLPQDGRCELNILGHAADVRISILPTIFGEKAVLRILDRNSFLLPKSELGFTEENLHKFDELLKNPHGIILVTGPTGSGKSTTLYTMLNELNAEDRNIITVEDPVEYTIAGLNQVQVNTKAGLDFAVGLRSILRQDPDIIMIGEIRDRETVEIAIRAAITGHLVLSTIHTNDAAATVARLMDMGVAPYMLSSALVGVIAQRLVRKICPSCREEASCRPEELAAFGLPADAVVYHGRGCQACNGTGYRGRMAVHEVMPVDRELREMIHRGATTDELRDHAIAQGMTTLKNACSQLLAQERISLADATAVAFSQDNG
ncbi:MAG: ATPase, T2SS/T4P/T4SS family [Eubacteriales bacterium]|nr:ATPase, T2SS/T4P/T4SS family [Eubacteriales bacterium]